MYTKKYTNARCEHKGHNIVFAYQLRACSRFSYNLCAPLHRTFMAMTPVVVQQFRRTKLCTRFFSNGVCRDGCSFAHSSRDLRDAPNLRKTSLCKAWKRGQCYDEDCHYAHGVAERRVTSGVFKTQQCTWFASGHCKHGNRCHHAHGEADVQQVQVTERALGQLVYAI